MWKDWPEGFCQKMDFLFSFWEILFSPEEIFNLKTTFWIWKFNQINWDLELSPVLSWENWKLKKENVGNWKISFCGFLKSFSTYFLVLGKVIKGLEGAVSRWFDEISNGEPLEQFEKLRWTWTSWISLSLSRNHWIESFLMKFCDFYSELKPLSFNLHWSSS